MQVEYRNRAKRAYDKLLAGVTGRSNIGSREGMDHDNGLQSKEESDCE